MIEFFVKRPVTTIMFVSVFVIMGIVSYLNLSMESTPRIDFPFVTVKVVYPGAAPHEVESQIVKKIEDAVSEISEIKKLHSRSFESLGFVFIEFQLESDVNVKSIEVKDKVEAILNDLPDNSEKPIIERFDPMARPIMELILSSTRMDGRQLYEFADKKLKSKFSAIEGVASTIIYGGKRRQINIKLDPMLLKRHYLTIDDVISAIKRKNMNVPGGNLDRTNSSFSIRFVGEFQDLYELQNMKIISRDGHELKLKDIGSIEDTHAKIDSVARFDSNTAVGISLKKISGANTVDIGKRVLNILPEVKKIIPEGTQLTVAANESDFVITETIDTEFNILLGIILTVLVLYIFTGKLRLTIIASVVIPTSIVSSCFPMDFSHFTINMMTLLAFATALGTLIANAIVIIENVLEHIEQGKDPKEAAINGTKEVSVAVLAAAGTNLVVFTPIAFMGGIVGQFMKQFGLTVVYATIFSIIASFSLTPMLCGLLFKNNNNDNTKGNGPKKSGALTKLANKILEYLLKEYRIIFDLIFRFPKTTLLITIIAFISTFTLGKYLGNEFIPSYDEDKITVRVTLPQGSTIERTTEAILEVENIVKQRPEVESYLANIGENGVENARVIVNLVEKEKRTKSDLQLIDELIPALTNIPGVEIDLIRGEGHGPSEADVTINVTGMDYDTMIADSRKMIKIMEASGYFRSISSSYKTPKEEIRFVPDSDKLTFFDLNNASLSGILRSSIQGDDSNIYKEAGEEYKINVELNDFYKNTLDDIGQVHVISKKGLIPITALGNLKRRGSYPTIWRRDKDRIIQINAFLSKSTAGQVRNALDKEFAKKMKFKPGHGYKHAGSAEMNTESQQEIIKAFILATILTYMALAAILNSFIYPFVIVTSVATSFGGVILFLFFGEFSINIASMLAMVMLVGLVVNNAILMLDYAIRKIREGKGIIEALWLGASVKFRAILMTSIAIVFGAMPQLRSVMLAKASMASVIMGGMLASIIFTFVLIPVIFWYFERIKQFVLKKF